MKILSIDTSTSRIGSGIVELAESGEVVELAASSTDGATKHAEALTPGIKQTCADAGLALADLDAIVVGLGPGPFTGLRVGIVTAAALSDALGVPVWGVCSLDALLTDDDVGVGLHISDARRKEVYYAVYDGMTRRGEPSVAKPAELAIGAVDRVVHAGAAKYLDELRALGGKVIERYPSPSSLVRAAVADGLIGAPSTALTPIYLRRPDAVEPKPRAPLDVTGPTLP